MFDSIQPITIAKGLKTMKFRLWDENMGRLITFRLLKKTMVS
jgi:hypothetical protein